MIGFATSYYPVEIILAKRCATQETVRHVQWRVLARAIVEKYRLMILHVIKRPLLVETLVISRWIVSEITSATSDATLENVQSVECILFVRYLNS